MQLDLTNRLSGRRANISECDKWSVLLRPLPLNSDIMVRHDVALLADWQDLSSCLDQFQ